MTLISPLRRIGVQSKALWGGDRVPRESACPAPVSARTGVRALRGGGRWMPEDRDSGRAGGRRRIYPFWARYPYWAQAESVPYGTAGDVWRKAGHCRVSGFGGGTTTEKRMRTIMEGIKKICRTYEIGDGHDIAPTITYIKPGAMYSDRTTIFILFNGYACPSP